MLGCWYVGIVRRYISISRSLILSNSRTLDLSTSYSQAKKANLFFERYLVTREKLLPDFAKRSRS